MKQDNNAPVDGEDSQYGIWKYGAKTFVPTWCKNENHWTVRFTEWLFIGCACCLLFRGVTIGAAGAVIFDFFVDIRFL